MQNVVGNQHITLSPVLQGEVFQHTCEGHQDKHHGVPYSLHLLSYTKKAGIAVILQWKYICSSCRRIPDRKDENLPSVLHFQGYIIQRLTTNPKGSVSVPDSNYIFSIINYITS